jgi:predicted RNA-binding Zn-ribbon protein involved in translation (DUF1610 family)
MSVTTRVDDEPFGHCDTCGRTCDSPGVCPCGGPVAVTDPPAADAPRESPTNAPTTGQKLFEIKVQCTNTDRYRVLAANEEEALEVVRYGENSELMPPHEDDEPFTNWETAEAVVINNTPTHLLVCEGCGHEFTVAAEFDLADCPQCGRDGLSERQKRREKYMSLKGSAS